MYYDRAKQESKELLGLIHLFDLDMFGILKQYIPFLQVIYYI